MKREMNKAELLSACDPVLDKVVSEAKAMEAARDTSDKAYRYHKNLHDKYYAEFTRLMDEYLKG